MTFDTSAFSKTSNTRSNVTLTGIAPEGTTSLEFRCISDGNQGTAFSNAKLIALPIG